MVVLRTHRNHFLQQPARLCASFYFAASPLYILLAMSISPSWKKRRMEAPHGNESQKRRTETAPDGAATGATKRRTAHKFWRCGCHCSDGGRMIELLTPEQLNDPRYRGQMHPCECPGCPNEKGGYNPCTNTMHSLYFIMKGPICTACLDGYGSGSDQEDQHDDLEKGKCKGDSRRSSKWPAADIPP